MRFLIVGGGALGTVVAGYLSRAGHHASLFVKPAHAAAFASPQVRLTGIVDFTAPVDAVSDPAKLGGGGFDYLINCVKGRDTDAALAPLRSVAVEAVLSLQNGVKKDDVLATMFGRERVLGALALVSGQLIRPGEVLHTAMSWLPVGELDGRPSARAERLADVLQAAGIPSTAVPDIVVREWDKLRLYLSLALISALSRVATVEMVFDPDLRRACLCVGEEVATVAAAEGYSLGSRGDSYLEALETFAEPIRERGVVHWMSLAQDLQAGRPTELEWTAGDVLDRAERHGIRVPVIRSCTDMLRGIERLAHPHEITLSRP